MQESSVIIRPGLYSEITIRTDTLVKRNFVRFGVESTARAYEDASRRCEATIEYHNRLCAAGVRMPATTIRLDTASSRDPCIEITAEKIPAPTAVVALPTAPLDRQVQIVSAMLKELLKVMRTQVGVKPIGYDSGFDNFIIFEDRCYLIDLYPARLGYEAGMGGKLRKLREHQLLVNYPEIPPLVDAEEKRLRHFYYTPEGTVKHFVMWAVALSNILGSQSHSAGIIESDVSQTIIDAVCAMVQREGFGDCIAPLLHFLADSACNKEFWENYIRIRDRYASSCTQWRSICHLF